MIEFLKDFWGFMRELKSLARSDHYSDGTALGFNRPHLRFRSYPAYIYAILIDKLFAVSRTFRGLRLT